MSMSSRKVHNSGHDDVDLSTAPLAPTSMSISRRPETEMCCTFRRRLEKVSCPNA
jgi:hypothetical protein